jgi:hypothetical protein
VPLSPPRLSPAARALRYARSCYNHLAGELAVEIAQALQNRSYLRRWANGDHQFVKLTSNNEPKKERRTAGTPYRPNALREYEPAGVGLDRRAAIA